MTFESRLPRRNHHEQDDNNNKYLKIRNILNSIFILMALVGMGVYFWKDRYTGGILIIVSMVFKFAECCLRMMKR